MSQDEWEDLSKKVAVQYRFDPEEEVRLKNEINTDPELLSLNIQFPTDVPDRTLDIANSVHDLAVSQNPAASYDVRLTQVSTLVCQGQKLEGSGFIVTSWAKHWGVIIDEVLWHLLYNPKTQSVSIGFRQWETVDPTKYTVTQVGTTRYEWVEIRAIGIHPVLFTG